MTYQPGKTLKGKYRILSELGEGGFGIVYKAVDITLERIVALKVLRSNLLLNNEDVSRIKTEAQLLAKLMHPNIVSVFAFEMIDDTVPVLVMEYIEGKTLDKRISEASMDYDCFNDVLSQVCSALQFAHKHNIIHRDLSPRNILLVEEGNRTVAKIIDFGLSKLMNPNAEGQGLSATTITATGYLVGNPQYMSPEVCLGLKADSVSDIYSLGCILYEMLCGHQMFTSIDAIGTLYKQQHDYPPIPELYWDAHDCEQIYKGITLLCLQKERHKRPQSAADIIACLENQENLRNRLSKASAWHNNRVNAGGDFSGFALLACFALIAICGTAVSLSARKVDVKQVHLGPAKVKHIESKSVMATLLKIQNFLSTPAGQRDDSTLKQMEKDLDLVIGNRSINSVIKFVAYQYKATLINLDSVSSEEKIAALASCIPLSQTAEGHDTQQTATILYQMATQSPGPENSFKYARRAFAVYEKEETKALDVPKEFRTPLNTVTTADICNLLSSIADQKGNSEEALKWLQMGVKKSNPDVNWHWRQVCAEAAYLKKLGRLPQAQANLKRLLTSLSDSATYDPGNPVFQLSASDNIRSTINLGDWCAFNGFEDFAKVSYLRAAELIEQTGLCKDLTSITSKKLDALKNAKRTQPMRKALEGSQRG